MSGSQAGGSRNVGADREVKVRLDDFAWEAVQEESARLEVSVEDFIAFSVLYYLADIDSGRIARRITRSPYPDASR